MKTYTGIRKSIENYIDILLQYSTKSPHLSFTYPLQLYRKATLYTQIKYLHTDTIVALIFARLVSAQKNVLLESFKEGLRKLNSDSGENSCISTKY